MEIQSESGSDQESTAISSPSPSSLRSVEADTDNTVSAALEGVFLVFRSTSHPVHRSVLREHKLSYRDILLRRFKVDAESTIAGGHYVAARQSEDVLSDDLKTWMHNGIAEAGSHRGGAGSAEYLADKRGGDLPTVDVNVTLVGDFPWDRPMELSYTFPVR